MGQLSQVLRKPSTSGSKVFVPPSTGTSTSSTSKHLTNPGNQPAKVLLVHTTTKHTGAPITVIAHRNLTTTPASTWFRIVRECQS